MTIIYNFTDKHIAQLSHMYKELGWGERSVEDIMRCLQGSQICIGIIDNNQDLIGFTRVISDFIYKALIFDVMVSPEHRRKGLGQKLISLVKSHEKLIKVKHLELYCLPELVAFYTSLGFSTEVGGITLMRNIGA
jgi:GNAT superfamily N-acetyltransferase